MKNNLYFIIRFCSSFIHVSPRELTKEIIVTYRFSAEKHFPPLKYLTCSTNPHNSSRLTSHSLFTVLFHLAPSVAVLELTTNERLKCHQHAHSIHCKFFRVQLDELQSSHIFHEVYSGLRQVTSEKIWAVHARKPTITSRIVGREKN